MCVSPAKLINLLIRCAFLVKLNYSSNESKPVKEKKYNEKPIDFSYHNLN